MMPPQDGGGTDAAPVQSADCGKPSITFVIDGSGSMCDVFGNDTRWGGLRRSLLDPDTGLFHRWQSKAAFGVSIFDGTNDLLLASSAPPMITPTPSCAGMYLEQRTQGVCPQEIVIEAASGTASAIDAVYPLTELGGSTPTDKALKAAVDRVIASQPGATPQQHPKRIVLVTDNLPNDICVGSKGGGELAQRADTLATVDRAAAASIRTYAISMNFQSGALGEFLDEIARHGAPLNPSAHAFAPADTAELQQTLDEIMQSALECDP